MAALTIASLASKQDLDPAEQEYVAGKRGQIPDDQILEDIRQYRAVNTANAKADQREPSSLDIEPPAATPIARTEPVAVPEDPTRATPLPTRPTLPQFMEEMNRLAPTVDDRTKHRYWAQHYSTVDPLTLPTLDDITEKIKAKDQRVTPDAIKSYWEVTYGDFGAREHRPPAKGFLSSVEEGLFQGGHQLKSEALSTFERLQDPESKWHDLSDKLAQGFATDAAKYAPDAETANKPLFQRLTNPDYLGNLIGNIVAQTAPSLGAFAAGTLAGGPAVGTAAMVGTIYFQQAGDTYKEAFERYQQDGLPAPEAHRKAYTDSGIAGLVSGVINSLAIPASMVAPFQRTLNNLALQYALNVSVDTADQLTQNLVASKTFAPERALSEGVPEAVVGSVLLGAPETMVAVKSVATGPAKVAIPQQPAVPIPTPTKEPPEPVAPLPFQPNEYVMPGAPVEPAPVAPLPFQHYDLAAAVTNPAVGVDEFINTAQGFSDAPVETQLPTTAELTRWEQTPRKRLTEETPSILQGNLLQGISTVPILEGPTETAQSIRVISPPSRPPVSLDTEPSTIEQERARLVAMRQAAQPTTQPFHVEPSPITPTPVPSEPERLPSALEKAYPSTQEVRALVHEKGFHLDTPVFRGYLSTITGAQSLTDLAPRDLQKLYDALQRIKPAERPKAALLPVTSPTELPKAEQPVEVQPGQEPQVTHPRSQLQPEQNAEMLLRAEKAQADLEIAGTERGGRFFTEQQGHGGTSEVRGLKSPTADWYKFLTSGVNAIRGTRKQSAREKIEEAVAKIIQDEGVDRGAAVEKVKAALLNDREFAKTQWGHDLNSILEGTWPSWVPKPETPSQPSPSVAFPSAAALPSDQTVPTAPKPETAPSPAKAPAKDAISELIDRYMSTGRSAFRYPRKKIISLDGRSMPEKLAIQKMRDVLARDAAKKPAVAVPSPEPQPDVAPAAQPPAPPALEAEPFALTAPKETKAKTKGPEQLGIEIPPETFGSRPLIGREVTPEEAPLFSEAAKQAEAEQTTLEHAIPAQGVSDRHRMAVETFSNLLESPSMTTERFGSLDAETQRMMVASVLASIGEPQVRDAIVRLVLIDVMDNLVGRKGASQAFLNDPSVLADPLSDPQAILSIPVARLFDALREAPAFVRTEVLNGLREARGRLSKDQSASIAGDRQSRSSTGTIASQGAEVGRPNGSPIPLDGESLPTVSAGTGSTFDSRRISAGTRAEVASGDDLGGDLTERQPTSRTSNNRHDANIPDFIGEKIGGARRDLAEKTGPTGTQPKSEEPGWRKRYSVSEIVAGTDKGKWVIRDTRKEDWKGQAQQIGKPFETQAEAEAAIPLAAVSRNHRVYQMKRDGSYAIYRKIGDRRLVQVVKQEFSSDDAATRYMAEHAEAIIETKTNFGEEILPHPETVQRVGAERRNGKNVSAEDFRQTFSLRSVEFGKWNNQDERQEVMNHAYDGLLDLADVLKIPPKAIGLNGELSLAFGARGRGLSGAAAHYERDYGVINLTKMQGAGHLAHEWFHAADHYFGRQDTKASREKEKNDRGDLVYKTKGTSDYASYGFRKEGSQVRPDVREAYTALIRTMLTKAETYVEDAEQAEKFVRKTRDDVATQLANIRDKGYMALSRKMDTTYTKRKVEPASAAQLAEFDGLAQKILAGEFLETTYTPTTNKSKRNLMSGRWTNDALEKISTIYKDVRGRSGFGSGDVRGPLDELRTSMKLYSARLKMLADAQASNEKTKSVPTSYAMHAKSLDQGRNEYYWMTNHEMAARAFSAYVEDTLKAEGKQSDFITYGTHTVIDTPWGWQKPYPEGEERTTLNRAFDTLFSTLRTKETDQGTALFARDLPSPEIQAKIDALNAQMETQEGVQNAFEWSPNGNQGVIDAFQHTFNVSVVPIRSTSDVASGFLAMQFHGNIFIDTDQTRQGFVQLAGHELLHQLRKDNASLYEWFATHADAHLRDSATSDYRRRLEAAGADVAGSNIDVREELLSDFAGDALADPAFLQRLAEHNHSKFRLLMRRVMDWLKQVAGKLDRAGFGSSHYFDDIEGLRQYLAQVLDAYRSGNAQAIADVERPQFARDLPSPNPFYSQVVNTLESKMPNRASMEQVRGILSPANGVKSDELKWLGMDEFIKTKDYFTKEEVLKFVRENQVQVQEVVKGEDDVDEEPALAALRRNDNLGYDYATEALRDVANEGDDWVTVWPDVGSEDRKIIQQYVDSVKGGPTRFAVYQLPGGTNYRELLLTLPVPEKTVPSYDEWKQLQLLPDPMEETARELFGQRPSEPIDTSRERYEREKRPMDNPGDHRRVFRSSHFDEHNVLVHIRFNDRTGPNGEKILFLEEVQSDWHQKGRREGYQGVRVTAKPILGDAHYTNNWYEILDENGKRITEQVADSETEALEIYRRDRQIPNAPFKKTWHELALKRMLRYAAEHGYDSLAWTPGSVQANRYDLSKQIDSLQWDAGYGSNLTKIALFDVTKITAFKDDAELFSQRVPDAELEDAIGKDLAKKILDAKASGKKSGEYSGLDLKVGGTGMKGFYDEILPAFLNKYGKKWGAKVGETTIQTGTPGTKTGWETTGNLEGDTATVHAIPITATMKHSVLTEGQALFENSPKYAVREGEQQSLNFDLAKAALGDLDRITVLSSTGGTLGGAGVSARTLALGISPDLIHEGVVDLTGYAVHSAEDLARLAQVYRDPRFETFRIIYLRGTTIVGHEGMTSRMPGIAIVFKSKDDAQQKLAAIDRRMDALGATGYYLLHNHPSGNSSPSREDFKLTETLAINISGFKGHVIIDSNQYDTITLNESDDLEGKKHALDLGPDLLLTPSLPHPLLGSQLDSAAAVAAVGQKIKSGPDYATVLYRSGSRTGATRAIQEVAVDFLADAEQAGPYLQSQAVAFGASQIFVHCGEAGTRESRADDLTVVMDALIEDGTVTDYVTSNIGWSFANSRVERGVRAKADMVLGQPMSEIASERVAEPSEPFTGFSPSTTTDTGMIDPITVRDRLRAAMTSIRPYFLNALTLNQLSTVYGREHEEATRYNHVLQKMEAEFTERTRASDDILKAWDHLKVAVSDKMARVMEAARRTNYDPDGKIAPDGAQQEAVKQAFDALPTTAQDIYRQVRDFYTALSTARFEAIANRITRAGGTPENTKSLIDKLHVAYDYTKDKIYFPLTRFGPHIVFARQMRDGKEVDREVHKFESPLDADRFATLMRARGWAVKRMAEKEYSREQDGAASEAVKKVLDIIQGTPIDTNLLGMVSPKAQLLDAINQLALESLPEMSYAKHFIHAKDVKGSSKDALRTFAHSALHGAHHISRINHADAMEKAITDLDARIRDTQTGDVTESRQLYNNLVQRHGTIMNPNISPVAAWLGQLGFTMSLGGVIATGATNLTQVPLVTLPWLGARFGFARASAALAVAYNDFLDIKTLNADSLFDASKSERLSESERAMEREMQRRGRIDLTQTMDLSGRAAQDNLSRVARQAGSLQEKIAKMLGFTFHAPEVANRQVTALATYRLALADGLTDQQAVEMADTAIMDTHFIYTSSNRAPYMSGNVLRTLTMFKQYGQRIAFLYGRAAYVWLDANHASPEERGIAKRQLLSMAGLQFAAAGALGLPFIGTGASLLMAVMNGFGDDDEKKDWEVELRNLLAEQFGKEGGEVLSHGVSRLTPWDMAGRLGQNDLFFRGPKSEREGRAAAIDWITSFSGPVLGYAVNAYLGVGDVMKGIKDVDAGHFLRGIEELTPAVMRNAVKAFRYELEGGVRTRDQHKQIDLSGLEELGQFFGFAPSRSAEMYESVTAIRNQEHRLTMRRNDLLDQYASATQARNATARASVMQDIRAFNQRHRFMAITGDTLVRSMKGRLQRERGTTGGLYLPRKKDALREVGSFGNF